VDITSIKRKKATLDAMANVLNEFLHGVSKGFQDAAFASFSRRRSTVREDINQSFGGSTGEENAAAPAPASAYLDLINAGESAATTSAVAEKPKAIAAPKRGRGGRGAAASKGVVDAKPARRSRKTGGRGRGGDVALKEV
jgi:hypothetical protein